MRITVDREGEQAINELCDAALRVGGIKNFNRVRQILESVMNEVPEPGEQDEASESNPRGAEDCQPQDA